MGYFDSKIYKNYKTFEMSTFLNNFDFEKSSKWDPKIPKLFLHHLGSKCPIVYLLLVGRLLLYANGKQNEMSFWCHKTSLLVWPKLFLYEIEHLVSFYYIFIKKVWIMWYSIFNVSTLYIMYIIVLLACKNSPKKVFGYLFWFYFYQIMGLNF